MADISVEKEQERKLERMAHYDALTGLTNRFLLSDRLTQAIENAHRTNHTIAVMFIDLDGFKSVNDKYGHEAGDALLRALSQRFTKTLRTSDTLSRIGGDEFVIVVTSHNQPEDIASIEARLLDLSTKPVEYEKHELMVSSSIGIVIYDPFEHSKKLGSEQLIRYADQAMYHAKELGKNRSFEFEWGEPKGEFKLDKAIKQNNLKLFYQPKINFGNNDAPSFEALIRWDHPVKDILPPAAFLNQISTTQNKIHLAEFVMLQSLRFIKQLREQTGQPIELSINVDSAFLLK